MYYKEKNSQDMYKGVLVGAVIGAIAGVLLAPKVGGDMTNDLVKGARSLVKQAKSKVKQYDHSDENSPFWLGGILGSLLSGASNVILSPKSGSILREYIADSYQNVSDKTWQLINNLNEKGDQIADLFKQGTVNWADKSLDIAESVTDEVHDWVETLKDATAQAKEKAEQLGKNPAYQSKIADVLAWVEKATEIADEVTHEVKNWKTSVHSAVKCPSNNLNCDEEGDEQCSNNRSFSSNSGNNSASQLVEWATVGYNIWQNLQRKK